MIWLVAFIFICTNLFIIRINSDYLFSLPNVLVLLDTALSCGVLPWLIGSDAIEYSLTTFIFLQVCTLSINLSVKIGYASIGEKRRLVDIKPDTADVIKYSDKMLLIVSWIMLFIGIIALILFTAAFGGYKNYVENGALALRAGVSKVVNKWSFLQPFCEFPEISFLVFMWYFYKKDKSIQKYSALLGMIVSGYMCYLVLIANKARMALIVYILVILFSLCDINIRNKVANYFFKVLMIVSAFASALLVSVLLGRGAKDSALETIKNGVSFVFYNFSFWYDNLSIDNYRWFVDYLVAPLYILPSRIWSGVFGIRTISENNTYLQLGSYKGTGGVTGEIPMDFISCVYCQCGFIGLFVIGYVLGKLLMLLSIRIKKIEDNDAKCIINYYIIFEIIFRSLTNGDPEAIITRNFPAIAFLLMLKATKIVEKLGH